MHLVAILASLVTVSLRLVLMPEANAMGWEQLPSWARTGIVFVLTTTGSFIASFQTGDPWPHALLTGIEAGFTQAGLHKTTAGIGRVMTQSAVAANPDYQPGWLRKASSIIVPMERIAVAAKAAATTTAPANTPPQLPQDKT